MIPDSTKNEANQLRVPMSDGHSTDQHLETLYLLAAMAFLFFCKL
jgi:hypothetical protein